METKTHFVIGRLIQANHITGNYTPLITWSSRTPRAGTHLTAGPEKRWRSRSNCGILGKFRNIVIQQCSSIILLICAQWLNHSIGIGNV